MTPRPWTCRSCKHRNASKITKKCASCGKTRPKTRRPAHMKALDLTYEQYVEINGGDFCWIGRYLGKPCGEKRKAGTRRLNRDHDHKSGKPRGLLCGGQNGHNKRLGRVDDEGFLEAAAAYLRRTRTRRSPV